MCPFNFGEARALRECLIFMMNSYFNEKVSKAAKNQQAKKITEPKAARPLPTVDAPTIKSGDDEVVF